MCFMGIVDIVFVGLELEFFLFDDVKFVINMFGLFFKIDDVEVVWNIGIEYEDGNKGYCLGVKGGYFLVVFVDLL